MLPDVRDDPYYQLSQITHKKQSQPDSTFRTNGKPQKEQIFLPSPGRNTLVCAASLPAGVKAKVRLLVWKGKIAKWCLDDTTLKVIEQKGRKGENRRLKRRAKCCYQ